MPYNARLQRGCCPHFADFFNTVYLAGRQKNYFYTFGF